MSPVSYARHLGSGQGETGRADTRSIKAPSSCVMRVSMVDLKPICHDSLTHWFGKPLNPVNPESINTA